MAQLEADPTWVSARAERERELQERVAEFRSAAAPFLEALAKAGLPTEGFARLQSTRAEVVRALGEQPPFDYRASVPLLIEWLPRVTHVRVKEFMVRSLTTKFARPVAARPLLEAFRGATDDSLRWAIGNALATVSDSSVLDDLLEIAEDDRFGASRQMIVGALYRWKRDPRIRPALVGVLGDDDVVLHAVGALGRCGTAEDVPALRGLGTHSTASVRKAATRAIASIERRHAR